MRTKVKINEVYKPLYTSDARYNLLWGGRAAGRSFAAAQYFLLHCMQPQYFRGYIMREVFGDLRDSVWQLLKDLIDLYEVGDQFHLVDNVMKATHLPTGNQIIAKGFKKSSGAATAKLKSLAEASHVLIEEAIETKEIDFDKLDDSLRTVKTPPKVILCFNPEDDGHWIHKRWFTGGEANNDPNLTSIHTTYKDNIKNLDPGTVQKFLNYEHTNPVMYKLVTCGLWVASVTGRIFSNWQKIEAMPNIKHKFYGLDFGYTNDPAAIVELEYHNDKLYIDLLVYKSGMSNSDIAEAFKQLVPNWRQAIIYADSSEPKSIDDLKRNHQLTVFPAAKGAGSINQGIDWLKSKEVNVTHRSRDIWDDEYKYYVWKQSREGIPLNVPIDDHNHAMDAIRYGCERFSKGSLKSTTPRTVKRNTHVGRSRM